MKKKRLGEASEVQKQLRKMGASESAIQQESDALITEFDLGNKEDRAQVRKDIVDVVAEHGGTMVGDILPSE